MKEMMAMPKLPFFAALMMAQRKKFIITINSKEAWEKIQNFFKEIDKKGYICKLLSYLESLKMNEKVSISKNLQEFLLMWNN